MGWRMKANREADAARLGVGGREMGEECERRDGVDKRGVLWGDLRGS